MKALIQPILALLFALVMGVSAMADDGRGELNWREAESFSELWPLLSQEILEVSVLKDSSELDHLLLEVEALILDQQEYDVQTLLVSSLGNLIYRIGSQKHIKFLERLSRQMIFAQNACAEEATNKCIAWIEQSLVFARFHLDQNANFESCEALDIMCDRNPILLDSSFSKRFLNSLVEETFLINRWQSVDAKDYFLLRIKALKLQFEVYQLLKPDNFRGLEPRVEGLRYGQRLPTQFDELIAEYLKMESELTTLSVFSEKLAQQRKYLQAFQSYFPRLSGAYSFSNWIEASTAKLNRSTPESKAEAADVYVKAVEVFSEIEANIGYSRSLDGKMIQWCNELSGHLKTDCFQVMAYAKEHRDEAELISRSIFEAYGFSEMEEASKRIESLGLVRLPLGKKASLNWSAFAFYKLFTELNEKADEFEDGDHSSELIAINNLVTKIDLLFYQTMCSFSSESKFKLPMKSKKVSAEHCEQPEEYLKRKLVDGFFGTDGRTWLYRWRGGVMLTGIVTGYVVGGVITKYGMQHLTQRFAVLRQAPAQAAAGHAHWASLFAEGFIDVVSFTLTYKAIMSLAGLDSMVGKDVGSTIGLYLLPFTFGTLGRLALPAAAVGLDKLRKTKSYNTVLSNRSKAWYRLGKMKFRKASMGGFFHINSSRMIPLATAKRTANKLAITASKPVMRRVQVALFARVFGSGASRAAGGAGNALAQENTDRNLPQLKSLEATESDKCKNHLGECR